MTALETGSLRTSFPIPQLKKAANKQPFPISQINKFALRYPTGAITRPGLRTTPAPEPSRIDGALTRLASITSRGHRSTRGSCRQQPRPQTRNKATFPCSEDGDQKDLIAGAAEQKTEPRFRSTPGTCHR